ncbi:MAG: adenylate kinase [Acidimicrobiaceae bacterium]|jgi:adenylate kinase
MRIILLGAPGSGKGTQGKALAERFGVRHISTGDVLRRHIADGTELGALAAPYVQRGDLVPDDVMLQIAGNAAVEAAKDGGYVLDGFPRTLEQAERAYEFAVPADVAADAVVYLAVPDDVARERLATRAVAGRVDDNDPAVVERRLRVFHEQTEPLLEFYRNRGILVPVDASHSPAEVTEAMLEAVRPLRD